jgi:hypothetical protein
MAEPGISWQLLYVKHEPSGEVQPLSPAGDLHLDVRRVISRSRLVRPDPVLA